MARATKPDALELAQGHTRLEQAVLRDQLRAPAYSLGTAESHPWLIQLYEAMGFEKVSKKDLGKGHITVYMQKNLHSQHAR